MDSTPGPSNPEPNRPESAPAWFLVLGLVLFLLDVAGSWCRSVGAKRFERGPARDMARR